MDTYSLRSKSRMRRQNGIQTAQSDHAMIEMRGVVKTFENAAGRFTALKGIDLSIQPGEFVSIVGKSGSGKSTLLNMITGIDFPSEGQVVISGTDIYSGVTESQRSRWRGRNLGIVFQFFQLLPMLTLLENVMLPMDFADMYAFEQRPARALELLKLVGLEDFKDTLPAFVSNGQQQLAAIARALACDPPLLVADEPTGNLDHKSAVIIVDLFEQLVSQGKTILMVTHDPGMSSRTTRNIIISDGELVDERVAGALGWLPDRDLLSLSKLAQPLTIPAGGTLIEKKLQYQSVYLVLDGRLDLEQTGIARRITKVGQVGKGDVLGEIEAARREPAQNTLRAWGQGPVELLAIPADDFRQAVLTSPAAALEIDRRIEQRRLSLKESRRSSKKTKGISG